MLAERAAKLVDALFVASCGRGAGVSDDGLFVGVGEAGSRGLGRGFGARAGAAEGWGCELQ